MGDRSSKRMSAGARLLVRALPLPLVVGGGIATFFGVRGVVRAGASLDWPSVAGVVRASSVERSQATGTDRRGSLRATVRYEYVVDGETYEGDRVAYGDYGSILRSRPEGIVDRYTVGTAVSVYYMPDSPEESVLEPGIELQTFLMPLFGAVLLGLGITGLAVMPKALAQLDPPDGAADVRVVDRRRL